MPYHYGTPSSTPSSTSNGMSSGTTESTTNGQGRVAPAGYHYMPDGTLMSNLEHARLHNTGAKKITGFEMNFDDVAIGGETRRFVISGDEDAVFSLEVRDLTAISTGDILYYNFQTNSFQATEAKLKNISIGKNAYTGNIIFPKSADGSAKQYDIYLFAHHIYNTEHAAFNAIRFADDTIDINSSTGSNSNLIQKVIYQTADVDLTISAFAANSVITSTTIGTQTISASRTKGVTSTPFSITVSVAAGALSIDRQPTEDDLLSFVTATVGAAPIDIPGEDIYPAVTNTDVVNGDFSAENTNKFVMDTNVADKMSVEDRVTTATTTDTVDGAVTVTDGLKIVMDTNVVEKICVGDRITITTPVLTSHLHEKAINFFDTNVVTVAALNPDGDNAKEFSIAFPDTTNREIIRGIGQIADGATLTFSSKLNREVITVAALNPDTDNAKEFSVKDANGNAVNVGIRDNSTLSFSNRRNYRWPLNTIYGLEEGMTPQTGSYFASATTIKEYLTETTVLEGEQNEYKIDDVRVPALDTLGAKAVITRNASTKVATTVQSGNVVFSNQALFSMAGQSLRIFSYGTAELERLTGYNIEISDLTAELNKVTTTTTAAVSNSTTIPVTAKLGIVDKTTQTVDGAITDSKYVTLDSVDGLGIGQSLYAVSSGTLTGTPVITSINETNKKITLSTAQTFADGITLTFPNSIISGPGIDNTVVNPYVDTISSLNLTASAAQTLENAQTLTFTGAGNIVTITGNIKINKIGNEDLTLRFDIDKFLTQH